jgi:mono/diheme cytochrome c family protein
MIVIGHCNNCHTPDYQKLAGNVPDKDWLIGRDIGHTGPLGTSFPANLRSKVNQMTEAEWVTFASTLTDRPGMPTLTLRKTKRDDLAAMYQFIKSLGPSDRPSRPMLAPGVESHAVSIRQVAAGAAVGAPRPESPPTNDLKVVPTNEPKSPISEMLERGRYMLMAGHCHNCHTENYAARQGNVPERDWLKGSSRGHRGSWGTTYPTNLRTFVGLMSEDEWVLYAKSVKPRPPMPWWALHETKTEDLRAMYQVMKSLGPPGEPAPASLPPDQDPKPPYTVWPPIFPE